MARLFEYDESEVQELDRYFEERRQRPYSSPSPVTPIPRRASASAPGSVRVRSRYTSSYAELRGDDVTRLPTVPPSAIWQDEAIEYEVERHLALQPIEVPEYSPLRPSSPSIDELDTLPPYGESFYDDLPIATAASAEFMQQSTIGVKFPLEIPDLVGQKKAAVQFPLELPDPVQPGNANVQFPLEIAEPLQRGDKHAAIGSVLPDHGSRGQRYRAHSVHEEYVDVCEQTTNPPPVPFHLHPQTGNELSFIDAVIEADTVMDDRLIVVPPLSCDIDKYPTLVEDAVDIALTIRARELLHRSSFVEERPAIMHNPLDYVRWWLLCPGRLEFLCWLGGAMLLAIMMCMALVMMGLGLGWMSFGHVGH